MKLVVVADDDPDILSLVGNTLQARGYQVLPARDGQQAWQLILRELPDAAVLDVEMPFMTGFDVLRRVRSDPHTRNMGIILLTGRADISDKVSAFEVGADDYMIKPFQPRELTARLGALIKRTEETQRATPAENPRGQVIALFGAKGGVGTSTLAANLAVALAASGDRVCLVDLDLEHAVTALLLDIIPSRRGTIADLSKEFETGVDWALMDKFLVAHRSGVSVFPGPMTPAQAELVTGEHVKLYLGTLRGHFTHIVVDLPSTFRDTTLDVLESSDRLLLVSTADLLAIKTLRGLVDVLLQLGVAKSLLQAVVNQVTPAPRLSVNDVKQGVGIPVIASVPYGGDQFVDAVNEGTPLVEKRPQHPASQAIRKLAEIVAAPRHQDTEQSWR